MYRKSLYETGFRWGQPPPEPIANRESNFARFVKRGFFTEKPNAKHLAEDHFNDLPLDLRLRIGADCFADLPADTRWDLTDAMKGLLYE